MRKLASVITRFGRRLITGLTVAALILPLPMHAITSLDAHALHYDSSMFILNDQECTAGGPSGAHVSGDNPKDGFFFLTGKGLSPVQAAGVIGNLLLESGMDPARVQDGGGPGRGIAQWTVDGRWTGVIKLANDTSRQPTDLAVQLEYLWFELETVSANGLAELKAAGTVEQATQIFMDKFERPGVPHFDMRLQNANDVFAKYASSAPGAGTPTGTTANGCPGGGGVVSGSLIQVALSLAWPDPLGPSSSVSPHSFSVATKNYQLAWNGASDMTDCGAYVSTVMVKSGADTNYPPVGTINQRAYVQAHPELYLVKPVKDSGALVPGDILITDGHTLLYVGVQNTNYNVAEGSLGDHTPQLDNDLSWMLAQPGVVMAHLRATPPSRNGPLLP